MSQTDFHKYTNTPEFKELLSKYESTRDSGASTYFDADDLIDIAEYYHIQGRVEQSEDVALYCLEIYPDNSMALLFLARICLIDLQDITRAREYFDKVKCEGTIDRLEYIYVKAELMMVEEGTAINVDAILEKEYAKRQEKNNKECDSAEDDDEEENGDVKLCFALDVAMLYCDHGLYVLAERWLKKQEEPEDMLFEYWETWGRIHLNLKRFSDAIECLNKALDIDAYNVNAWMEIAEAQMMLPDINGAQQSIEFALAISPQMPEALFMHGNILYDLDKIDEAIEVFQKMKDIVPDEPQPYLSLGALSLEKRNVEQAMSFFKQAMELVDYDILVVSRVGICLYEFGLFTSAYLLFNTILTPFRELGTYEDIPQEIFPYMAACCKSMHNDKEYKEYKELAQKYSPNFPIPPTY